MTQYVLLFVIPSLTIFFISFYLLMRSRKQKMANDPMILSIREDLEKIHPKAKTISIFKANRSYTDNKKHIYLCLKNKNNEYYERHMLLYVALHELAHVIDDKFDNKHRPEFQSIFYGLLKKASDLGIYDLEFKPVKNYCQG